MKRLTILAVLAVFCLTQFAFADDKRLDKVNWETFSKNLVTGLKTGNDGVSQAALKNIITFADRVDVDDAVFDIIRIYKHSDNERFRQMAVVALLKIKNKRGMDFLKRNLKYESNPTIKSQILHGLQNNMKKDSGLIAEEYK